MNTKLDSPCLHCENREIGCHDKCRDYQAYHEERVRVCRIMSNARYQRQMEYLQQMRRGK